MQKLYSLLHPDRQAGRAAGAELPGAWQESGDRSNEERLIPAATVEDYREMYPEKSGGK